MNKTNFSIVLLDKDLLFTKKISKWISGLDITNIEFNYFNDFDDFAKDEKANYVDLFLISPSISDAFYERTLKKIIQIYKASSVFVLLSKSDKQDQITDYKTKSLRCFFKNNHLKELLTIAIEYEIEKKRLIDLSSIETKIECIENIELGQEGIFTVNDKNIITFVNLKMTKMIGYNANELIGKSIFSLLSENSHEMFNCYLLRSKSGIKEQFDLDFVHKSGAIIFTTIETAPFFDKKGNYSGTITGVINITERRKMENNILKRLYYEEKISTCSNILLKEEDLSIALNKVISHLREVTSASRVYICKNIYDESNNSMYMQRIFESCADNIISFINDENYNTFPYDPLFSRWKQKLSKDGFIWGNISAFPEDEQTFFKQFGIKSLLVLPVFIVNEWFGYIAFEDTISEKEWYDEDIRLLYTTAKMIGLYLKRKNAEEELKNYQLLLENLVENRTAELKEAKEQAEKINRMKDEFLAYISHEIRSPLGLIALNSSFLMRKKSSEEQSLKKIEQIGNAVNNAIHIIDEVLDISRIESGILEIEKYSFNLSNLCDETIEEFRIKAQNKDIVINQNICKESVYSDPKRIRQILSNLISNALKYTEKGKINISAKNINNELTFSVEDTGKGISQKNLDNIFEPFFRESDTKYKIKGMGLGLSICKNIVKHLKGKIFVESEIDKGSKFSFSIPLDTPENIKTFVYFNKGEKL